LDEVNVKNKNQNSDDLKVTFRDIVASVGPVSVVICIEDGFHDYHEGVYNPPTCCTAFDHAPVVVGYGKI
jgi:Papain family cysteine protease